MHVRVAYGEPLGKDVIMLFWIAIAIVAAICEVLTTGLFFATVASAALLAAGISIWLSLTWQLTTFAVAVLVGLVILRPFLVRSLGWGSLNKPAGGLPPTHLHGKRGVVTQAVDDASGQIRVGEGEFWSARSYLPDHTLDVGTKVEVISADGFLAWVAPVEEPIQRTQIDGRSTVSKKGTEA